MGLPEGVRYGFISQEVQEVLPQLTTPVHQPEQLDSLGNVEFDAVDYLGLSPLDILPIVVGAVQGQHVQGSAQVAELASLREALAEQRTRMDQLESMLAACCNNPDAGRALDTGSGTGTDELLNGPYADRKLRIVPNPFSEPPTVYYTLDRGGRMQLIANSADGKQLNVLQEATMQAGNYQYAWDTSALAPGMYYVTLLLDGQPMVKKAVKVTR